MDDKLIRKYAEMMKELGLTAFELTEGGCTFRLEMTAPVIQTVAAPGVQCAAPAVAGESAAPSASSTSAGAEIASPMVGVFYSAPAENAEPFVSVGKRVKRGDTLCIIETMKLMNEITAEVDGVISEICVANGQVVDYGCILFRMEKE